MLLENPKPNTPSQRNFVRIRNFFLRKSPFLKSEIHGRKKKSGRNNLGIVTSYHKGGGHKQKYRSILFIRTKNSVGIVTSVEYDPNRNANIASICDFLGGTYYYILAPKGLFIGDIVKSGNQAVPKIGNSLPIRKIPVGSLIHNVSIKSKKKAQISRAAGSFSKLIEKSSKQCQIELSSGEHQLLSAQCFATIGIVSNELFFLTTKGKAGRNRWLNKRPKVRGVAKNPVDHPHGGGEGKTSGGRVSVTPWGKPCKGTKTTRLKNRLGRTYIKL